MTIFKTVEIKIAVFIIVGLFLLVWGINFLQGIDIFKKQYAYHVEFERTDGLLPSHSVVINGMIVGIVDKIQLMPEKGNKVLVTIKVDKDVEIPVNTEVSVYSPSPLSSPQVNLVFGDATTYFHEGDTIMGITSAGMLDGVGDLVQNLKSVVVSLDTIAASLKTTIQTGTIDSTLANIESVSNTIDEILAKNSGKIDSIVNDLHGFTGTIHQNDDKINHMIANIDRITDELAGEKVNQGIADAAAAINKLDTMLNNINNGQGTMGQLVVNDSLYHNLKNSLNSLDLLLSDLKANPKKYINVTVFGKKEKKQ